MRKSKSLEQRFWNKVIKKGDDECWEWTGCKKASGHGIIGPGPLRPNPRVPLKVHRLSWELAFGPIPDKLCVCHHCDNPPCVNPKHLFLGTNAENTADKMKKGRFQDQTGEKNPSAKLTRAQVDEILDKLNKGMLQKDIAAEYKMDPSMISRISTGKSWYKGEPIDKRKRKRSRS